MNPLPKVNDCQGCDACCLHMGYPAFVVGDTSTPAEPHWDLLPDDLKQELVAYIENYQSPPAGELDGPCFWLDHDSRLCKHHQYRPEVCRRFQVGSKECRDWRDFYRDRIHTGD